MDVAEHLALNTELTDTGCLVWQGKQLPKGYYGFDVFNGKSRVVHRVSYETFVGSIPAGLELDHLCRNKLCINPDHLEPVTSEENNARRWALQTHCKNGHEFNKANTRFTVSERGHNRRICRVCETEGKRKRRRS